MDTIIADLTTAMKAKDADRTSTLRMVKANLMNRKIEKGGELTDEEVQKALQSLVKQRRDSIEQYEKAGRADLAAKEAVEIGVIEAYLPQAVLTRGRRDRRCRSVRGLLFLRQNRRRDRLRPPRHPNGVPLLLWQEESQICAS